MSTADRSLADRLPSVRARAILAVALLAALVLSGDLSTPLLAVAGLMGAMALVVIAVPAVSGDWRFNVLVGTSVVLYGLAYAIGRGSLAGRAVAAAIAALGLLVVANHLGVAPWSDHPRRV